MEGYRTVRAIGETDLELVPVFVGLRTVWLLGLQALHVGQRGTNWVDMFVGGGGTALHAWMEAG